MAVMLMCFSLEESIYLYVGIPTFLYKRYFALFYNVQMGQSIQEWAKWSLWKTAFKSLKWFGVLNPLNASVALI